jgi:chromate transporter
MEHSGPATPNAAPGTSLRVLAGLFLRLGATAFGGPAAHIAMMEEEVVRRRRWLTTQEFLDLVGASNLIPGPTSTELAIHIGHRQAGAAGLMVAGACFIAPAAAITLLMAWLYVRFGRLPVTGAILYGVKPVIIAVIVQALLSLGGTAAGTWRKALVALASAAALVGGWHELAVLAAAGALGTMLLGPPRAAAGDGPGAPKGRAIALPPMATLTGLGAVAGSSTLLVGPVAGATPLLVFGVFLKIGSVLFGSGYVLLAFLRAELVERLGWMNEAQLLDAVAVGQVTPGPVFSTATFIGYLLGRLPGAAAATAGIFLPAFVFAALSGPLIPRLRRSPTASAFLDGVNAASLALMAVVTWQLGRAALTDWPAALLAVAAAAVLTRTRASSAWLVLAGAAIGIVRHLTG